MKKKRRGWKRKKRNEWKKKRKLRKKKEEEEKKSSKNHRLRSRQSESVSQRLFQRISRSWRMRSWRRAWIIRPRFLPQQLRNCQTQHPGRRSYTEEEGELRRDGGTFTEERGASDKSVFQLF